MNTCAACRHAKPTSQLNQRICMVGPPSPVVTPSPGGFIVSFAFPMVRSGQEAPACFSPGIYGVANPVVDHQVLDHNEFSRDTSTE